MASLFEEAKADDPRVRRFLALALGRLGDARAVPALLEYLAGVRRGEGTDSETHIYATWALGAIGDAAAVPELVALAAHEDPGLRKTAVHALRRLPVRGGDRRPGGSARRPRRRRAVERGGGPRPPRRPRRGAASSSRCWTASSSAGARRSPPIRSEEILLQAIAGAALLPDARLDARLAALGNDDPSLKVRAAARRGLERAWARRPPPPVALTAMGSSVELASPFTRNSLSGDRP